ncbi:MAG TPA: RsmE family RNA methyltransferase, partial [Fimbriimonas sp.]
KDEIDKIRKVLRLSSGAQIAVLPNDGSIVRCIFRNHAAEPVEVLRPESETPLHLTLAQALPKGDKLDEIVRACTEIGVSRFVFFPSDRTVVRWDEKKTESRMQRLQAIARESAEVSFRVRLPEMEIAQNLEEVLRKWPEATVLSEVEGVASKLCRMPSPMVIVVGPEGGWSDREIKAIGSRGATLGPRVLRVDHAGPAAAAILLLQYEPR